MDTEGDLHNALLQNRIPVIDTVLHSTFKPAQVVDTCTDAAISLLYDGTSAKGFFTILFKCQNTRDLEGGSFELPWEMDPFSPIHDY